MGNGGQPFHAKLPAAVPAGSVSPGSPCRTSNEAPLTPNGPLGHVRGGKQQPPLTPRREGPLGSGRGSGPGPLSQRAPKGQPSRDQPDSRWLPYKKLPYSIQVGDARGFTWDLLHKIHPAGQAAAFGF